MNETVRQKLREIVARHGLAPLADPRLCESLLKDYCGQHKKEIFVLVCAVREQIATDLLTSAGSIPQELLHPLLIKRLQNNLALTEEASRWAVESWALALANLAVDEEETFAPPRDELEEASLPSKSNAGHISVSSQTTKFEGEILGRCEGAVRSIACAPDGESFVCGSDDATVRLWRFATQRMETICKCVSAATSVAFSPDGTCVAAASEANAEHGSSPLVSIMELQTGELIELGECSGRAPQISYSPGGNSLAAVTSETENGLRIWNLRTGHTRIFKGEARGFSALSFSPLAKTIATGEARSSHAALHIHDLETAQPHLLGHCERRITSLAFSTDGKQIASGSWDETVRLWNLQAGRMSVLGKNCSRINCIAFSRDGEHLAACSLDGRIRIWNVRTAKSRTIGECHGINSATFSADGRHLLTGSSDGALRQWRVPAL